MLQSGAVGHGWERPALAGLLVLAGLLNLLWLDREGYGNTYYAAAVKSMLTGWRNFFFASFDAGGFVAVDKPPLGLWLQVASAKLLGFTGPSLLLPQAIAGVLAVLLLARLVRSAYGPVAGLLAGLALALTPVSVVTNRNNTSDAVVVLTMLGAAWAVVRATQGGRVGWLLLAVAFVGLGFNIKMLQAYLVLPAIYLTYLVCSPRRLRWRLADLTLATVVLLAVSLVWAVVVDLTPPDRRPYVGSSGTDSQLSLMLGYNGLGRLAASFGAELGTVRIFGHAIALAVTPSVAPDVGTEGPLRLLNEGLGGQVGWLLPLAVAGLLVAGWRERPGRCDAATAGDPDRGRRRDAILLWGSWFLTQAFFFSTADFFHTYYLVTLAPAVAALAAIGVVTLWDGYRRGGAGAWGLPLALVGTAGVQAVMLSAYPEWSQRLTPLVVGGCLVAAVALILARFRPRLGQAVARTAVIAGVAVILATPAAWSAVSVAVGAGGEWLPRAGPPPGRIATEMAESDQLPTASEWFTAVFQVRGPFAYTFAGRDWNVLDPKLVDYLLANQGEAPYLVATETSTYASLFILATDQPAMALGGYQGWDRILTPGRLNRLVENGTVRFFLLPVPNALGVIGAQKEVNADLSGWVRQRCAAVPEELWQTPEGQDAAPTNDALAGTRPFMAAQQLYDCGDRADRAQADAAPRG